MINRYIPERTPEELQQRLRELKRGHSKMSHQPLSFSIFNKKVAIATGLLAIVVVIGGALAIHPHNAGPVTASLQVQAGFPLFTPNPLPQGIFYAKQPASISQGIVTYSLTTIHGSIMVIEQAFPSKSPDFSQLSGATSTKVNAGTSYTTSSQGRTIDIISSNTTLISITADHTVPTDQVLALAKSLASLPD
jgi:hypothetical protein